jgi:LysR family transcriptional regulator, nitrogen assimilation regulatory protein
MRLERLQVVSKVAELGSLSKTAKALGIAQSVVSRHVTLLEAQWGDRLFERTGRGVALSEFGRHVLPQLRLLLVQADQLEAVVREASGVPSGLVRLGVLPSISRLIVGRLVTQLQQHSAIQLRVTEGFSGDLDAGVADGTLDLAIFNRYGTVVPRGEEVVGHLHTYLVGQADDRAVRHRQTVAFSQLAQLPLALPGEPNGLRTVLDQLARQKRMKLNVAIEIDTISAIKDFVLQHRICTLLPLCAVADEVRDGRLAAALLVKPGVLRTISIGATHQHPMSLAARHVWRELCQLVPQVLPPLQ